MDLLGRSNITRRERRSGDGGDGGHDHKGDDDGGDDDHGHNADDDDDDDDDDHKEPLHQPKRRRRNEPTRSAARVSSSVSRGGHRIRGGTEDRGQRKASTKGKVMPRLVDDDGPIADAAVDPGELLM